MPKLYMNILCVLGGAVMAACASKAPSTDTQAGQVVEWNVRQDVGPAETVSLEQPVIRAEVLTVQRGTTIEPVSGTVYVTRDGEAINLKESQAIEPDDLLQLAPDSAARLRSPGGEEFVLTPKHGEWFHFDLGKK